MLEKALAVNKRFHSTFNPTLTTDSKRYTLNSKLSFELVSVVI